MYVILPKGKLYKSIIRNVLINFVIGFGKVFVAVGQTWSNANNEVEIVDLDNPNSKCSSPPTFPLARMIAFGGLGPNGNPMVCGGFGSAPDQSR
jgi:hypothetical protein